MALDFNQLRAARNMNQGNLGGDPMLVKRMSASLQKRRNFSKAWDVGDQATVFYPFKWWQDDTLSGGGTFLPHMAAYWGHPVSDLKKIGTTFLRSLSYIDEYGNVVGDGDLAYQFSRLAPLLVNAQKEHELHELERKDWSVVGQTAYQTARKAVEDKYDTKDNMKAIKPLIGRLKLLKLTEVVFILMDANKGLPIMDDQRQHKTGTYIQTLSDNRFDKLMALANDINTGILAQNPGLKPEPDKLYFLEVLYNFTSSKNSKMEAGRVDPQGVAYSVTILARNPSLKKKLDEWLNLIPEDPDGISAHTYNLSPMPDEALMKKLQTVMVDTAPVLHFLTPEDQDKLLKNAQVIDFLRVKPVDPALTGRITEVLGHPIGEGEEPVTLASIMTAEGAPDFKQQHVNQETLESMAEHDGDEMEALLGGLGGDGSV
mgnify:CR=1 FL=1